MGVKLGKMTLGSIFKKPETIQYPAQTKVPCEGLKGHVVNDIEVCILCGICAKRCPADALVVDKPNKTWSINYYQCVQCGSCIRECPKTCLTMEPAQAAAAVEKSIFTLTKPEESEEDKAAKAAKEAEKKARVEAALAAKAAKQAKEVEKVG